MYSNAPPGLQKLDETEIEVKQLQIELAELKPLMEAAAEETAKVIEQIAIDTVSYRLPKYFKEIIVYCFSITIL